MSNGAFTVRIAGFSWALIIGFLGCQNFSPKTATRNDAGTAADQAKGSGGLDGGPGSGGSTMDSVSGSGGSSSGSGGSNSGSGGSNDRDAAIGGPTGGAGSTGTPNVPATGELGAVCAADRDCGSGHCVDGVCCESTCSGSCEACGEANSKGQCVAVTGKPRPGRAACPGGGEGTCAGACDGINRNVCAYPGASQSCRGASCTANVATVAAGCDGKGACPPAQTVACAPNACAGTICAGGCSDAQPCTGTNFCLAGKCVARKATGQTCQGAAECTSGFCVDGYCCNSECGAACNACNLAGLLGTCSPVKSAIDDSCNGARSCDAQGTCKKSNGQTCAAAADCSSGACVDGRCCGAQSCGACQACTGGGGTCAAVTSAEDADSCSSTKSCDGTGACKLKTGQTCTAANQCASGFCADGVCCNSACGGSCEACGEASSKGTCSAVTGAPRSGHNGCAGAGTSCGGSCDGTNRTACAYPSSSCRAPSCTGTMAILGASCDGKGGCPAMQTVNCAPNACSGTACAGGCSSSQPCAGTNYCNGGVCVAKKGNGTACGGAAECTSGSCVDGVCCGSPSCPACRVCTGANGTCVEVKNADDPDSCTGASTCDGSAMCKKRQGQSCTGAAQCITGNCADGVCCNKACTGACEYCGGNSASNTAVGTCAPISGAPRTGHGSCPGTGVCQGTCSGSQSGCTMPGTATMCRTAMCSSDTAVEDAFCDSSGNCPNVSKACGLEQSCSGTRCACQGYTLPSACGGCGSWNFEAGSNIEGWTIPQVSGRTNAATGLMTSSMEHAGSGSLAVAFDGTGGVSTSAWVGVRPCTSSQALNGSGHAASVWVYVATTGTAMFPSAGIGLSTGTNVGVSGLRISFNTWTKISASLSGSQGPYLIVTFSNEAAVSGTLYIDEVAITAE